MNEIEKMKFIHGAKLTNSRRVISYGEISRRDFPEPFTVRIPLKEMEWVRNNLEGNKNFFFVTCIRNTIKQITEQGLQDGDFNISDLLGR